MKKNGTTPEENGMLIRSESSISTPTDDHSSYLKPCPGVTLFLDEPHFPTDITLIHPPKPGVTPSLSGCGVYASAVKASKPGNFMAIRLPDNKIDKLTVQYPLRQIARMCNALDDMGVYWMIFIFGESPLARKLFKKYNFNITRTHYSYVLSIVNFY